MMVENVLDPKICCSIAVFNIAHNARQHFSYANAIQNGENMTLLAPCKMQELHNQLHLVHVNDKFNVENRLLLHSVNNDNIDDNDNVNDNINDDKESKIVFWTSKKICLKKIYKKSELMIHAHVTAQDYHQLKKHIVPLCGFVILQRHLLQTNELWAVMPLLEKQTLEDWFENLENDKEQDKQKKVTQKWVEGDMVLEWLHEQCGIIHGDVHLGNWFLLHENGKHLLQLGDFGESKFAREFDSLSTFLWFAGHERLEFRFNMEPNFKERKRLGSLLYQMENRKPNWMSFLEFHDNDANLLLL